MPVLVPVLVLVRQTSRLSQPGSFDAGGSGTIDVSQPTQDPRA
jgi:hypothetical protein